MNSTETPEPRLTAQLGRDGYGFLQPRLQVQFQKHGLAWATAATQLLMSKIELATPAAERWTVELQSLEADQSVIVISPAETDSAEAKRAMALLEALVNEARDRAIFEALRLPEPGASSDPAPSRHS